MTHLSCTGGTELENQALKNIICCFEVLRSQNSARELLKDDRHSDG